MANVTRREFLEATAQFAAAAALSGCAEARRPVEPNEGVEVNDVQSQLNATRVRRVVRPLSANSSVDAIVQALRDAGREGRAVSVAGGRHSMGGQQFGTDMILLDMTGLDRVVRFDRDAGRVEVEAGIEWPRLMAELERVQVGDPAPWGIRQKQTGVDAVSLGGSLASNIHGRGLRFPPLVGDVESFVLVDASGEVRTCSRSENPELFALAIGGYGLFGVIARVTLRLVPRTKVERLVKVIPVKDLLGELEPRLADGFQYGDCQYSPDLESEPADHPGVFACYRPVPNDTPIPEHQKQLSKQQWVELYRLARTDKKKAFEIYSAHYLATNGQIYWSDTHQLAGTLDYYHEGLKQLPAEQKGTEMITEVYVPREELVPLLVDCRRDFVENAVDPTYGTIRFIEKDNDSFLAWAQARSVCIVCNLHVIHTDAGIAKARDDFRRIIDRAIQHRGRYYLTYHRFATREQVEACYPRMVDFLRLKRKYDPQERFQSDWYRHYRSMFEDEL